MILSALSTSQDFYKSQMRKCLWNCLRNLKQKQYTDVRFHYAEWINIAQMISEEGEKKT